MSNAMYGDVMSVEVMYSITVVMSTVLPVYRMNWVLP